MIRFTGIVLILLGILVRTFFGQQHVTSAPGRLFMNFLNIALIPTGILLFIFSFWQTRKYKPRKISDANRHLKETGHKIMVTIDDCEFKSHNYELSLADLPEQFESFEKPDHGTQSGNILQSLAIFTHKTANGTEIFQSPVFPMDIISLKAQIMRDNLVVYVDPDDHTKYYFELNDPGQDII
jgi:hypothetical protein